MVNDIAVYQSRIIFSKIIVNSFYKISDVFILYVKLKYSGELKLDQGCRQ